MSQSQEFFCSSMSFVHYITFMFTVSDSITSILLLTIDSIIHTFYISAIHILISVLLLFFVQGNLTPFQQQQTWRRYMIRIFQPNRNHHCRHHHCHRPSKEQITSKYHVMQPLNNCRFLSLCLFLERHGTTSVPGGHMQMMVCQFADPWSGHHDDICTPRMSVALILNHLSTLSLSNVG